VVTVEHRPNRIGLLLGSAALVVAAVIWVIGRSSGDGLAVASTVGVTSLPATTLIRGSTTVPQPLLPSSRVLGSIPSPAGVVVFARTFDPNAVLRVDIDTGVVASTPIGSVLSTAPTYLVVGPTTVVVRPYDNVRGYVVDDNNGAVTSPGGLLDRGAYMACADGRRNRIWLGFDALVQVDFNGTLVAQLPAPERPVPIGCDGAGEMLYRQGSNTFVTSDGLPTLVTAGDVIAAGPTTFLVRDCATCELTVVDRATGKRHAVTVDSADTTPQSFPPQPQGRIGSISPDGRTAALFHTGEGIVFVDLRVGASRGDSTVAGEFQSLVWSSDSRYLFFIRGGYQLSVFDRDTLGVNTLGVDNVLAVASRPK
jgi:hypothetical protein